MSTSNWGNGEPPNLKWASAFILGRSSLEMSAPYAEPNTEPSAQTSIWQGASNPLPQEAKSLSRKALARALNPSCVLKDSFRLSLKARPTKCSCMKSAVLDHPTTFGCPPD